MIYFARLADSSDAPIKIGYTRNITQRWQGLEGMLGGRIVVLGMMQGGPKDEKRIHARFATQRIARSEQFRQSPDLLEFIESKAKEKPEAPTILTDHRGRPRIEGGSGSTKIALRSLNAAAKVAEIEGVSTAAWISRVVYEVASKILEEELKRLESITDDDIRAEVEAKQAATIAKLMPFVSKHLLEPQEAS